MVSSSRNVIFFLMAVALAPLSASAATQSCQLELNYPHHAYEELAGSRGSDKSPTLYFPDHAPELYAMHLQASDVNTSKHVDKSSDRETRNGDYPYHAPELRDMGSRQSDQGELMLYVPDHLPMDYR